MPLNLEILNSLIQTSQLKASVQIYAMVTKTQNGLGPNAP